MSPNLIIIVGESLRRYKGKEKCLFEIIYVILLLTIRSFTKTTIFNAIHCKSNTMPFLKAEQLTNVFRGIFCVNYEFTLGNFMKPGTGCHNTICLDQRAFASRFTGHLACILCSSVSSVISKETYITTVLENGPQG